MRDENGQIVTYDVGDIVSRHGDDRHIVVSVDAGHNHMDVMCIREPDTAPGEEPWIRLGEIDGNMMRRYGLIKRCPQVDLEKARSSTTPYWLVVYMLEATARAHLEEGKR